MLAPEVGLTIGAGQIQVGSKKIQLELGLFIKHVRF